VLAHELLHALQQPVAERGHQLRRAGRGRGDVRFELVELRGERACGRFALGGAVPRQVGERTLQQRLEPRRQRPRGGRLAAARSTGGLHHQREVRRRQPELTRQRLQLLGDDAHRTAVGQRHRGLLPFDDHGQAAALHRAPHHVLDRGLVGGEAGAQAQLQRQRAPVDGADLEAQVTTLRGTGREADAGHAVGGTVHSAAARRSALAISDGVGRALRPTRSS
jgi:hypothetical protein